MIRTNSKNTSWQTTDETEVPEISIDWYAATSQKASFETPQEISSHFDAHSDVTPESRMRITNLLSDTYSDGNQSQNMDPALELDFGTLDSGLLNSGFENDASYQAVSPLRCEC